METVGEVIGKVRDDESPVTWVSVAYGKTRTINYAMNREALLYVLGLDSGYVIFRKRGGFLAYRFVRDFYSNWIRTKPIKISEALERMEMAKKTGRGLVYGKKDFLKELVIYKL
jgi:hypothetical protein